MTKKLKEFLERVKPWQGFIAIVVGVVGAIYGTTAWIRTSAQNAVLDEKFLATLTFRVRPVCIFDTRGAIEADLGASEYIYGIRVIPAPQIYGYEIVVNAKRHLAYPPLITGLDADLFPQTVTRGKLHDWSIILSPQSTAPSILAENRLNTNEVHRFKLEILH